MITLPNPSSYEAVGWIVVLLLALGGGIVGLVVGCLTIAEKRKNLRASVVPAPQPFLIKLEEEFTKKAEFQEHKEDVARQLKEGLSYTHDEVHKLRGEMNTRDLLTEHHREGLHDRINKLVEIAFEMRGKLNTLQPRKAP